MPSIMIDTNVDIDAPRAALSSGPNGSGSPARERLIPRGRSLAVDAVRVPGDRADACACEERDQVADLLCSREPTDH